MSKLPGAGGHKGSLQEQDDVCAQKCEDCHVLLPRLSHRQLSAFLKPDIGEECKIAHEKRSSLKRSTKNVTRPCTVLLRKLDSEQLSKVDLLNATRHPHLVSVQEETLLDRGGDSSSSTDKDDEEMEIIGPSPPRDEDMPKKRLLFSSASRYTDNVTRPCSVLLRKLDSEHLSNATRHPILVSAQEEILPDRQGDSSWSTNEDDEEMEIIGPSPPRDEDKPRKRFLWSSASRRNEGLSPIPGPSRGFRVRFTQCHPGEKEDVDDSVGWVRDSPASRPHSPIQSFYEFSTMLHSGQTGDPDDEHVDESKGRRVYSFAKLAPSRRYVDQTIGKCGLFQVRPVLQTVLYSRQEDALKDAGIDVGCQKLRVGWAGNSLAPFRSDVTGRQLSSAGLQASVAGKKSKGRGKRAQRYASECKRGLHLASELTSVWQPVRMPPARKEVQGWLQLDLECSIEPAPTKVKDPPREMDATMVKLRVQHNSEDDESMGSEMSSISCSAESLEGINRHPKASSSDSESSTPDFLLSSQDKTSLSGQKNSNQEREAKTGSLSHRSLSFATQNLSSIRKKANFKNHQFISILSMEIHVSTRQKLLPDPEFDPVVAVIYSVIHDIPEEIDERQFTGLIMVDSAENGPQFKDLLNLTGIEGKNAMVVNCERSLIDSFVQVVQETDPDFLVAHDPEILSVGYLIRRAASAADLNLSILLSRLKEDKSEGRPAVGAPKRDPDGFQDEVSIPGRVVLNVWRLIRAELALTSFTFENVTHTVLKERHAKFSFQTLTSWWNSTLTRWRVLEYYLTRTKTNLKILHQLDFVGRTSELSRLFGIQFAEVISRGSQFRVESIMLRLVNARNFVAVSPSVKQRAQMRAPEYLPLVMEPESRLYGKNDPVVVLDFQSLYPSIIMAYNYCYSTCLGRVVDTLSGKDPEKPFPFGCTQLKISVERLKKMVGHLNFSPGGIAFVKPTIKRGILPIMLEEIIRTRLMVKRSMKLYSKLTSSDKSREQAASAAKKINEYLQKVLHARQLGLKLIANVTYGYTSANFSGRMPCIEVGDSVVAKGRETLAQAIKFIDSQGKDYGGNLGWDGARVVYGDTDSLFVSLPGRTKEEAFRIGTEMAEVITSQNPKPVKLKFEKVYAPCILQTKKRYVGYMYEAVNQVKPSFDAKGIETVRRDGIPASVVMLEKSLRILFETEDVSKVKEYVAMKFKKMMAGKIPLKDLTFAREFRGMSGYKPGACVPALELTRRAILKDRMAVPPAGWRVPYIVVHGEPGRPLIHSVRSLEEVLESIKEGKVAKELRPNYIYYITKVIGPAINRCLFLIGADALAWYKEMPKICKPIIFTKKEQVFNQKVSITNYFSSRQCLSCEAISASYGAQNETGPICGPCRKRPQQTLLLLAEKMSKFDKAFTHFNSVCLSCAKGTLECLSYDCPALYWRLDAVAESGRVHLIALAQDYMASL